MTKPVYTETARSCVMCGGVFSLYLLSGPRNYQTCRDCREREQERRASEELVELAWLGEPVLPGRAR